MQMNNYNHPMRSILLLCLLLAACAPQAAGETPMVKNLQPYPTGTASATSTLPPSLVVAADTPLPTATPFAYPVKAGDTLSKIAEKFNVSLYALLEVNPDVNPNGMSVGETLKIPSNPTNQTGESTPTPVPVPVEGVICYPTADRGMWCFVLVHNESNDFMENLSAQITLLDSNGESIASQTALLPLNILPPNRSLPLSTYFAPEVPSKAKPQVQILTAIRLLPGDASYLPATIDKTLVQVDWSGRSAQVSGEG